MKGILFDLDGVIADTAVYHFSAWRQLIKKHFNCDLPDELEVKTKGVSREDSLTAILSYLKIDISEEEFEALAIEKNQLYLQSLTTMTETDILPGIKSLIDDCKSKGLKLALASASKNGPIILDKLGLAHVFDAIVDPSEVRKGKPAPDIFLAAARQLDLLPSECVGLEDSVAGITAINTAGIVSIGVGGPELNHAKARFETTKDVTLEKIEKVFKR